MKNTHIKPFLLFLGICVMSSCSQKNVSTEMIHLNMEEVMKNPIDFKMSDFIKQIDYVPLENHPDGLIGKIGHIIPAKEYLLTAGFEQELFQFKRTGEFVRQIGRVGKGPGENSTYIDYFWIDETEEIMIWDQSSRQMIFYTLDGKWTRSVKVPHYFSTFERLSDREFLGYTLNPPESPEQTGQYMIIDIEGNKEYIIVPENVDYTKRIRAPFSPFIVTSNHGTFFKPAFSDTVYQMRGHELEPWLHIDIGNNKMPDEILYDIMKYYNDLRKYSFISTVTGCSGKWMMITVHIKGDWQTALIDLEKPEQIHLINKDPNNSYGILNDLDGGSNWSETDGFYKGQYYTCNSASWMLRNRDDSTFQNRESKWPEKRKELENLMEQLDPEDNPVVQIMTLK